jgi:hypothetical protein
MLGVELSQSGNSGAARQFIERSISLAESDNLVPVIEAGEQFTETPDPAFIDWKSGGAPLAPKSPNLSDIQSRVIARVPTGIDDLKQITTIGAAKVLLGLICYETASNATKFRTRFGGRGIFHSTLPEAFACFGRPHEPH